MSLIGQFKRLHKWMALLIGVQFILWIVSGIVFSFIDHRAVSGAFIYQKNQQAEIIEVNNFSEILHAYPNATEVSQITLLDRSVFKIVLGEQTLVLEPDSKTSINIDESLIKRIAEKNYTGGGQIKQIDLIENRTDENRAFALPSWKVVYDDEFASHIYFSAKTGEYQGIRTSSWRIFDFFMMLHFMDYGQRGDFNHALILVAALIMLFFSVSGVLLIYSGFSKQDFSVFFAKFYHQKDIPITLIDAKGVEKKIIIEKDTRLMDALLEQNIELDSACGGGGVCGLCRVKLLDQKREADLSDHDLLNDEELKEGYRLACQLSVDRKRIIEIPIILS